MAQTMKHKDCLAAKLHSGLISGARGKFPDDVSGAAVGPIFTGP